MRYRLCLALCQEKPQKSFSQKKKKALLEKATRSHSAGRRSVERANIILACAEGKQNQEIALDYDMSRPRVSKWCSRFAKEGMIGLEDARRCGKPATYGEAFRNALLFKLETESPAGLARWDSPTLAEALNASKHARWAIKKALDLHLRP
jgi:transposase